MEREGRPKKRANSLSLAVRRQESEQSKADACDPVRHERVRASRSGGLRASDSTHRTPSPRVKLLKNLFCTQEFLPLSALLHQRSCYQREHSKFVGLYDI